ncbi:hypothetical protein ACFYPZ_25735 [Streptomyces sp. NPDC005506]
MGQTFLKGRPDDADPGHGGRERLPVGAVVLPAAEETQQRGVRVRLTLTT